MCMRFHPVAICASDADLGLKPLPGAPSFQITIHGMLRKEQTRRPMTHIALEILANTFGTNNARSSVGKEGLLPCHKGMVAKEGVRPTHQCYLNSQGA